MRKICSGGIVGVAVVMLIAVAASFGTDGGASFALRAPAGTGPSEADIKECNEYARWLSARKSSLTAADAPEVADERLMHGALLNTGTLIGLEANNRKDVRAKAAYRQCMVRRGYRAWG